MVTLILAHSALLIGVALAGQIAVTLLFAKEAILTREGTVCRVKCTLAALMYGTTAILLAWHFGS